MKAKETSTLGKTYKGVMLLVIVFTIIITAVVTHSITKRKMENAFNPDTYNAGVQIEFLKTEIIKKNDSIQVLKDSIVKLNAK